MNHPLRFLLKLVLIGFLQNSQALAKPTWTFSVVVAVEQQTADFHQLKIGQPIDQIVRAQIATVNANFNRGTGFNGIYDFRVDSIYVFDGPAALEVFRAHPRFTYCVVVDGAFTPNSTGGGWYGDHQTIYHKWTWSNDLASGPFGPGATDGLTHEFAHARGAIDLYGLSVEGSKNPVNNTAFKTVSSIMDYPYGNITWDEHTTHLLNSTADGPIEGDAWITRPFPGTIGIQVSSAQGMPLDQARLELYPVEWFSYSVKPIPVVTGYTNSQGIYDFVSNPYGPLSNDSPWHIRYPNFLLKVTYSNVVVYQWMPLYEVQNAFFRNGADSAYRTELVFPINLPTITITELNVAHSCPGSELQARFRLSGSFDANTEFRLVVVDQWNNSYQIGSLKGVGAGVISGTLPYLLPAEYTLKIVSTNPSVQSNAYPFTLDPSPARPMVQPVYLCENTPALPLEAVGQNLRWYASGGAVLSGAPTPNTSKPGNQFYYVTQTIEGCESDKASLRVVVQIKPTLSVNGTTTAILGSERPLRLFFTGGGPYSYSLSNGLTGTASQDTTLLVVPEQTMTYQAVGVRNQCGAGEVVGNGATITVLIPRLQTLSLSTTALCGGGHFSVGYQTTGSFTAGNVFKIQVAKVGEDSTKAVFTDLVSSQPGNGLLSGTMPVGTPAGAYWVRVVATNPKIPIVGNISPTVLQVLPQPTATLMKSQTIVEGQDASLMVTFTGQSPWTFTWQDSTASGLGGMQSVETGANPYVFTVRPLKSTVYQLVSVRNECGAGTVLGSRAVVTVSPILGVDDEWQAVTVDVFPVPATTELTIRWREKQMAKPAQVTMVNLKGEVLLQCQMNADTISLPISRYSAGTYFLRIQIRDRWVWKRVIKQ
ncbi:T9SS type A sorting domain-containing protein [Larkinella bovis]|uniref:T9SS type A sorting domain-containing protein n=1 Tax=Larkinella bovis TaxID=683041 RepID=A0ABW0IKK6_9BACT